MREMRASNTILTQTASSSLRKARQNKHFRLFLLWFLLPFFTVAQQTINYSITVDTAQRDFILYVPASYTGNTAFPLVFSYHGLGGNAQNQMNDHDFRPVADTADFIVVHPEGAPIVGPGIQGWNFGNDSLPDDVLFTEAMIDTIAKDYNINLDRVYACGMSFGGYFSIFLAGQLGNRIASVASVAGTKINNLPDSIITPSRPLSLLQIHGTDDLNVPYNGNQISVSVQHILDLFVRSNNCDTILLITPLPDTNPSDGSTIERFVYDNGDNGTVVEHLKITGGRHTWPDENTNARGVNRDINGCAEIWRFFARYDLNGPTGLNTQTNSIPISTVRIYPNPVNAILKIECKSCDGEEYYKVHDLHGQLVKSGRMEEAQIDVTNLPAGVFMLNFPGRKALGTIKFLIK